VILGAVFPKSYDMLGPLAEHHQLSYEVTNFLAMHANISDEVVHLQLQDGQVVHLWVLRKPRCLSFMLNGCTSYLFPRTY
jgi:hypothetical protein